MIFYGTEFRNNSLLTKSDKKPQFSTSMFAWGLCAFESDDKRAIVYRDRSNNEDWILGADCSIKLLYRTTYDHRLLWNGQDTGINETITYDTLSTNPSQLPADTTACNIRINNTDIYYIDSTIEYTGYHPNGYAMGREYGFTQDKAEIFSNKKNAKQKFKFNSTARFYQYSDQNLPTSYITYRGNKRAYSYIFAQKYNAGASVINEILPIERQHYWYNIYVSEDYDGCVSYVNGGSLPTDAKISNITDLEPTEPDKPDVPDDENPSDDHNFDNSDVSNYNNSSAGIGDIHYYAMSLEDIKTFVKDIADIGDEPLEILLNSFTGLYGDLTSNVLQISFFPIGEDSLGVFYETTNVMLGNVTLQGFTATKELNSRAGLITDRRMSVAKKYNTFMDYAPYTTVQLFLPFHGFFPLDTNLVIGNEIEVSWQWDVISQTIQYFIVLIQGDKKVMLNTITASPNVKIPISLQDTISYTTSVVSKISNTAIGLGASVGGNPIGGLSVLSGAVSHPVDAMHHTIPSSNGGGMNMLSQFNKIYLLIKRPTYQRPANYNDRIGVPCMKTHKLKELTGYTECANPYVDFTKSDTKPLSTEIDEIYNWLKNGVIL